MYKHATAMLYGIAVAKEGGNRMNHYEAINDVLVNLFNEILDLEERALITENIRIFPSMICTLLMQ